MNASEIHKQALSILEQFFGYSSFREGQLDIIQSVCNHTDTLVVIPTGGGKSICYQIPALMLPGCAIVISPLIALMKDQVDGLIQRGIPAALINSTLSTEEQYHIQQLVLNGQLKLLYISPERLQNQQFMEFLSHVAISLIAIDEAHCISEWGHDFRPAYTAISISLRQLKKLPVLIALTATATPEVQHDIIKQLYLHNPYFHIGGFDRKNLHYQVVKTDKKSTWLISFLKEYLSNPDAEQGSIIIYCGSRRRTEEFALALKQQNIPILLYHAGLPDIQRKRMQEQFIQEKHPILIATSAFGMGVDKSNVRYVIHCDLTLTIEAYYQEAGRAGRDGKESQCILLYHTSDRDLMDYFLRQTYPSKKDIISVYETIYAQCPIGFYQTQPVYMSALQIGNACGLTQNTVQTILQIIEKNAIITIGNSKQSISMVQIIANEEQIKNYIDRISEEKRNVLLALLRMLGAESFIRPVKCDIHRILRTYQITAIQFEKAMQSFEMARMISTQKSQYGSGISLLLERNSVQTIPIDFEGLEARYQYALRKLNSMQRYAETPGCKRNFILEYFQDISPTDNKPCLTCSSCKNQNISTQKPAFSHQEQFIRHSLLVTAAELDGKFGKKTVIAVAIGDIKDNNVKKYQLDKAHSFGRLKGIALYSIQDATSTLVGEGLLHITASQYPMLMIETKGKEALKEKVKPLQIKYTIDESKKVLQSLQKVRTEIGQRAIEVHDYFTDNVLVMMSSMLPETTNEMAKLCNLPPEITKKYGNLFLINLKSHMEDEKDQINGMTQTILVTYKLAKNGLSLHDISQIRALSIGTIAHHIQVIIENGLFLEPSQFVSTPLLHAIKTYLLKFPYALLKEIKKEIGDSYDYAEIRIALCFARKEIK